MSGQCTLLSGAAAAFAQIGLAVLAIGALVFKRYKEKPRRTLQVWGMDVSKQIVSSAAAHLCGIFIAILVAGAGGVSQCAWYFVAYAFDTTVGVATAILLHGLILAYCRCHIAEWPEEEHAICHALLECGNYGTPPRWGRYLLQLTEWTFAVILARVICGSVVIALKSGLIHIAALLDRLFADHPVALLFFVMICCPLFMNLFQALVQDAILKFKRKHAEELASDEVSPTSSSKDRDSLNLLADSRQPSPHTPIQTDADTEAARGSWVGMSGYPAIQDCQAKQGLSGMAISSRS